MFEMPFASESPPFGLHPNTVQIAFAYRKVLCSGTNSLQHHTKGQRRIATALLLLLSCMLAPLVWAADPDENSFMATAHDRTFIAAALARERPPEPPRLPVTGVTVPHHLLAADLIARGVWAASGRQYQRILLLSPDHFRTLPTPFGISTSDLETVFGTLPVDRDFVARILNASAAFSDIGSAKREHGIHAVTPFLRATFPKAK